MTVYSFRPTPVDEHRDCGAVATVSVSGNGFAVGALVYGDAYGEVHLGHPMNADAAKPKLFASLYDSLIEMWETNREVALRVPQPDGRTRIYEGPVRELSKQNWAELRGVGRGKPRYEPIEPVVAADRVKNWTPQQKRDRAAVLLAPDESTVSRNSKKRV